MSQPEFLGQDTDVHWALVSLSSAPRATRVQGCLVGHPTTCPSPRRGEERGEYSPNLNITQPQKKKKKMPFIETWIDLEIIILSDVSQTEKDKYHVISLICGT